MKAKEYITELESQKWSANALTDMTTRLLNEIPVLIKQRKAQTVPAGAAIVREILQKYEAIVARSGGRLKPKGLDALMRLRHSKLMEICDQEERCTIIRKKS